MFDSTYDPTYPLFPIFCFLGFVLVLVPLPWHFQAWNSGTCFYIMWSALACLNQFINTVVWANDMVNRAPVFCDISIRLTLACSVGIPAASLCINRRLYQIASVKAVTVSNAQKRRGVVIDALICVLFPLVYAALQYIVQGHRFNIYQQIGCASAIYNSLPMYFLSAMWPPLIGVVSAAYGVMSLREFTRRRAAFTQLLSAHSSLTTSRYLRLMALSATDILLTTPLGIFVIWLDLNVTPIQPWISWADTHFNFSRVVQIPAVIWRSNRLLAFATEFSCWTTPITAFVFFAYFGFAAEARKHYVLAFRVMVAAFWRTAAQLGIRRPSSGPFASSATPSSPYTKPPPSKRSATATEDISLPTYSAAAATGSFTESFASVGDLKRASSFATQGSSSCATASRFFSEDGKLVDEEAALSTPEALSPPSRSPTPSSSYVVSHHETPSTATSFDTTTTAFVLLPHAGWHAYPYPADATQPSPTSSSPAQARFSYPQTQHEQQSRGPRSLV